MTLLQLCDQAAKLDESNTVSLVVSDPIFWLEVISALTIHFIPSNTGLENSALHKELVLDPFVDVFSPPLWGENALVRAETEKARLDFVTRFKALVGDVLFTAVILDRESPSAQDLSSEKRQFFFMSFATWKGWQQISHMSINEQERYLVKLLTDRIPNTIERQRQGNHTLKFCLEVYVAQAEALGNERLPQDRLDALCDAARHFHAIPCTMERPPAEIRGDYRPKTTVRRGTLSHNPIERLVQLFSETHG
jgi:hypothetical protein